MTFAKNFIDLRKMTALNRKFMCVRAFLTPDLDLAHKITKKMIIRTKFFLPSYRKIFDKLPVIAYSFDKID